MEYRKLTITIVSANDLPNVRSLGGKMRVYAVVSCNRVSFRTKIDMDNEMRPRSRDDFDFLLDEASVEKPGTHVVVRLYCKRTFLRDKPVGDEVAIEVKTLYDSRAENSVTKSVPESNGGTLNISYKFGQVLAPKQDDTLKKIFGCGLSVSACCPALFNVLNACS